MPKRVQWDPDYSTGNETLDDQHRNILAHCNSLADFVSNDVQQSDPKFHSIFNELIALAREHFVTEEKLLGDWGYPMLEEQKNEYDEFEYLVADIITTDNFDEIELQRFLALWWSGHIIDTRRKYRAFLEKQASA